MYVDKSSRRSLLESVDEGAQHLLLGESMGRRDTSSNRAAGHPSTDLAGVIVPAGSDGEFPLSTRTRFPTNETPGLYVVIERFVSQNADSARLRSEGLRDCSEGGSWTTRYPARYHLRTQRPHTTRRSERPIGSSTWVRERRCRRVGGRVGWSVYPVRWADGRRTSRR